MMESRGFWRYIYDVPKPVIGRKLDTLMEKRPNRGAAPSVSSPEPRHCGHGMRSLINGTSEVKERRRMSVPRWYLFGADLLLVAVAVFVMYKHPGPFTSVEKVFGVVAIVIGAGLAVIATCMRDPKAR
jgi:hypothetical protein